MRKRWILTVAITAVSASAVLGQVPAGAAVAGSTWRATEVKLPANAAANPRSRLFAIDCVAAFCAAGGYYSDRAGASVAMVVTASNRKWGRAQELLLPSNAAVDPGADVDSLSCTAAGSCVAIGEYGYGSGSNDLPLIATASKGKWARARTVRLPSNSASTPDAGLFGLSCTGPGSCVAVGFYVDKASSAQLMAAAESKGRWGRALAIAPPGNAADPDDNAFLGQLACSRVGYCSAVGGYLDTSHRTQALAATEAKGKWGQATEIRLPLNAGAEPYAALNAVVCSQSGTCLAVGNYVNGSNVGQLMAATQARGRWGRAARLRLPSNAGANPGYGAELFGVACNGSCAAVGGYTDSAGHAQAMAVARVNGRWKAAAQVSAPANAATGANQSSFLYAAACVKGGQCDAAGSYADRSGHTQPMVVVRV